MCVTRPDGLRAARWRRCRTGKASPLTLPAASSRSDLAGKNPGQQMEATSGASTSGLTRQGRTAMEQRLRERAIQYDAAHSRCITDFVRTTTMTSARITTRPDLIKQRVDIDDAATTLQAMVDQLQQLATDATGSGAS